jgi:hypothetical protein
LVLPNNTSFTGSELVKIKLSYNNGVPGSKGFLDKIELIAKRKLQGYGKQFNFQNDASIGSLGIVNYTLSMQKNQSSLGYQTLYASKIENTNQSTLSFKANLENYGNMSLLMLLTTILH